VGRAPRLHPRDILRAAKVVLVLWLGQPGAPARGLARLPASGCGTVFLVSRVARIGTEKRSAKQTLWLCWARHDSPSLRRIMQREGTPLSALTADPKSGRAKNEEDETTTKKSQKNSSEEKRRRRSTKKIHDFQIAQFTRLSGCR
jgi:hypothetical protein